MKYKKNTKFSDLEVEEYINYCDKFYKSWLIDVGSDNLVRFAEIDLEDVLFDEDSGHYLDKDTQYTDEDIGYYVSEDENVLEAIRQFNNEYDN